VSIPLPNPLPSNTLPANWILGIQLNYDASGQNISGATFTATDTNIFPQPDTYTASIPVPLNLQFPIVAFQVNVVGPANGANTVFSPPGAGFIIYEALTPSNELCIEGGLPDLCSNSAGSGTPTAETSNATYGSLGTCCGIGIIQPITA
jgi:hypothetical protein